MSLFLGYLWTNIKGLRFFSLLSTLSLQTKWKGLSIKYIKMESLVWTAKKKPKCRDNAYLELCSIGFIILKFRRFYYFKDSWNYVLNYYEVPIL